MVQVASDAVGMGLNLEIKRVVFSKCEKFDGLEMRPLNGRYANTNLHTHNDVIHLWQIFIYKRNVSNFGHLALYSHLHMVVIHTHIYICTHAPHSEVLQIAGRFGTESVQGEVP
jgi:hypothetical protein